MEPSFLSTTVIRKCFAKFHKEVLSVEGIPCGIFIISSMDRQYEWNGNLNSSQVDRPFEVGWNLITSPREEKRWSIPIYLPVETRCIPAIARCTSDTLSSICSVSRYGELDFLETRPVASSRLDNAKSDSLSAKRRCRTIEVLPLTRFSSMNRTG